ncbi:hypothetical protein [Moraxella lacunata]|uniref:hypothetical protein n=1 Tax=Moraxella lacunata TaxID=477 RepID=UPI003EDF3BEA
MKKWCILATPIKLPDTSRHHRQKTCQRLSCHLCARRQCVFWGGKLYRSNESRQAERKKSQIAHGCGHRLPHRASL